MATDDTGCTCTKHKEKSMGALIAEMLILMSLALGIMVGGMWIAIHMTS